MAGAQPRLAWRAIREPGAVDAATIQLLLACCAYR
jgi:hypothetical protein